MEGVNLADRLQRIGRVFLIATVLGLSFGGRPVTLPIGAAVLFVFVRQLGRHRCPAPAPPVLVPLVALAVVAGAGSAAWWPRLGPGSVGALGAITTTAELIGLRSWSAGLARWCDALGWGAGAAYAKARRALDLAIVLAVAGAATAFATGARFSDDPDASTSLAGQPVVGRWVWLMVIPPGIAYLSGLLLLHRASVALRLGLAGGARNSPDVNATATQLGLLRRWR